MSGTRTALTSQSFEEMCEPFCDGSQPPSPRTGPRFYVAEVEGYLISAWKKEYLSCAVIDSACGYVEVARFNEEDARGVNGRRLRTRETARARIRFLAANCAARLNLMAR